MKFIPIILLALAAGFTSANLDERSFKVNPGGTLEISLSASDIIINTWDRNEVQVRTGDNERVEVKQSGNTIVISRGRSNPPSDILVNIPSHFNLNISTAAGDHTINGNLKGNLEVSNSGGDISFNEVSGSVNIRTGGGDIKGQDINGSAVIESSGGDIMLGVISGRTSVVTGGGSIKIQASRIIEKIISSGGNIAIRNAAGNGSIHTGGGNIDIDAASGNLEVSSSGGNIRINETSGRIDVKTNGGDVRIREANGTLNAISQSGDIYVNFTSKAQSSTVKSVNGDIRAGISSKLGARITAVKKDPEWWKKNNSEEIIKSDYKLTSLQRNKRKQEVVSVYETGNATVRLELETNLGEIIIKKDP